MESARETTPSPIVMAGLVPATHKLHPRRFAPMGRRDRPGG